VNVRTIPSFTSLVVLASLLVPFAAGSAEARPAAKPPASKPPAAAAPAAAAPAAPAAPAVEPPIFEPGSRAITLAQALKAAAERNLSLRAARQQLMAATAGLDSALATRFPTLSAEANAMNPNAAPLTNATGGMTLAYDLDTHGLRGARIKLSEAQRGMADVGLAQASQAVRYEVMATFYDMQGAAEQVRIAALNLANARTSVSDAVVQREAGEATEFDVQRAKVQFGAAEQGLADARGALVVARRRMARVLGLDPREALAPAGPVEAVADWPLTLEASLAQALERRPELQMRELERQAAVQNSKMAWSARGVQTSVFANGDAASLAPGLSGGSFSGWPPGTNYTVGARMSWLLVDWGANGSGARQAEIGAEIAETQKRDAALQIQLDVEQAYAQMSAARANIRSAELALAVARQGLSSARLRFKGGVGTQTDVLLAQADLVQAEGNRVRAILAFNKAVAQLEQVSAATGL
jgi:outer membrane protein TolC